ncbi:predicted protein [Naegleria gruberi]|uniref:Predicted protein n=1 Tax=Naegleria gruberi TaxID=5762 RepID=D2VAN1_NAEGR|nr:uncharacterized protein NAEGRDRAFT_65915 [Naegleria gruberi]EFC46105.1 predicted protein [Naegleria gruberi]|eukprot:XP_002678849.1 predicted protein [Naegleria gruberi strain NEG-M]
MSKPTRTHKLPSYLEDYVVGEIDLRRNYSSPSKSKSKSSPAKTSVKSPSPSKTTRSSSSSLKQTAKISTSQSTQKRIKQSTSSTKQKKELVKNSIRNPSSSASSSSVQTVNPYNDFSNPKFKVFTSISEARDKLIEKTPGNNILKGSDDASKWSISSIDSTKTWKGISVSNILQHCNYIPGNNHKLDTTGSERVPSVQICFSFDTTISMTNYINNMKFKLQTICQQLMNDIRGLEIALIAHGDYESCKDSGSYVMSKLDFTTDIEQIVSFIQSLDKTNGHDYAELYECVIKEAQSLSWVPIENSYTIRSLVVIGDAFPHLQDECFNIDWKVEAQNLFDNNHVKIHAVKCGNLEKPRHEFYKLVAEETGGTSYKLDNFEKTIEMFCGLIYREATEHNMNDPTMQAHIDGAASGEITVVKPTMRMEDENASTSTAPQDSSSFSDGYIVTDDDILKIHNTIHDPNQDHVIINNLSFATQMNDSSCRYIRVDGVVYIEQNKEKKTKYAKMALEGKKLTWICHAGNWGLIIDDKIEKR